MSFSPPTGDQSASQTEPSGMGRAPTAMLASPTSTSSNSSTTRNPIRRDRWAPMSVRPGRRAGLPDPVIAVVNACRLLSCWAASI